MAKMCTVPGLERQFATLCLFHAPTPPPPTPRPKTCEIELASFTLFYLLVNNPQSIRTKGNQCSVEHEYVMLRLWLKNKLSSNFFPWRGTRQHGYLALKYLRAKYYAINHFWTKNPRGLLGWGSRASRQIIYVRIFPNVSKCFRDCQPA